MPADVAVAVRRRTQSADCTRKSGIAPPTPAALQDAGALVLGNDALNLKQEIVFGCPTDRAIEEHDLHAGPAELLNEQHLVGVAPRQPVGRVHVNPVHLAGRYGVAQALQRGAHECGAAAALVHIGVVRANGGLVDRGPLL
jgi:hypothetical protein